MKKLLPLILAAFAFAVPPVLANDGLEVDLSKPDVRLDLSFKGAELLLFGAKAINSDIIVVVQGPDHNTSVRLKERVAGVWMNTDEVVFEDAPSYYALAATKPVEFILPKETLVRERIGHQNLELKASKVPENADAQTITQFRNGLVRVMVAQNLYSDKNSPIDVVGEQLFRTTLWFPANVHTGAYSVDTYLVKDNAIVLQKTTTLQVHKVGIEAEIYNFAHEHALIFGLLAILIAVVSGWSANAVFKKRG